MCMRVCVYICVCMCVYVYIYMCVYIYIYIFVCVCVYIYTNTSARTAHDTRSIFMWSLIDLNPEFYLSKMVTIPRLKTPAGFTIHL